VDFGADKIKKQHCQRIPSEKEEENKTHPR